MADRPLSKGAIDRAGKRLRDDEVARPDDVAVYDQYRASLADSLAEVVVRVVSSDPARHSNVSSRLKRIDSVIDKLRRGDFRLTGINDIAGCRLIVPGLIEQDEAVSVITAIFPGCRVTDYRERQHISGYVAVHLNVRSSQNQLVEIQVRTRRQNSWAILSERLAQMPHIGKAIKYGGGPARWQERMAGVSSLGVRLDRRERARDEISYRPRGIGRLPDDMRAEQQGFEAEIAAILRSAGEAGEL